MTKQADYISLFPVFYYFYQIICYTVLKSFREVYVDECRYLCSMSPYSLHTIVQDYGNQVASGEFLRAA